MQDVRRSRRALRRGQGVLPPAGSRAETACQPTTSPEVAWREAIGVAILRGAAAVVAQAAPMGAEEEVAAEEDETAASQEHSPDAR